MIKERYLFLKEYNLEAIYFFDPLGSFIFDLFTDHKSFFFLSEATGFIILFTILASMLVYTSITGHFREKAGHSLLLGIFLSLGVYILRPDGLLHLTLFPLILFLLGASAKSIVKRFLIYTYSVVLSGPLAFMFLLIALLFQKETKRKRIAGVLSFLFVSVSFVATLFFSKHSVLFDYPRDAQLVPLSSLSHMGNVFFGPERLPLPLYAPSFIEDQRISFLLVLMLLLPFAVTCIYSCTIRGSFFRDHLKKCYRIETFTGAFLLMVLTASIFYSDGGGLTSVSEVLFRGIPGLIWRPYPFIIPAIILMVLLFYMLRSANLKSFYTSSICALIIYSTFALFPFKTLMKRPFSLKETVVSDPAEMDLFTLAHHSPSSFFMHVYGDDSEIYIKKSVVRKSLQSFSFKDEGMCHAIASRNNEASSLGLDGNHSTRWSTRGPQKEGDWYEIVCKSPVSVSQVHLSTMGFKSDFPRGMSMQIEKKGNLVDVFHVPQWYGSNQFTKSGLPYFGPQSDVVIDLPREVESTRFRFTLTKGHELYDWSIVNILFLK